MPPRPTSPCYQALQNSANLPVEALWMTDEVLGRAFQRYVNVSRAHKRTVSYAPGPMYHRKRFGRRQMTELNSFQSVGALPAWALSNAPNMMDWQWQPPKSDLWSPWPSKPPSPSPSTSPLSLSLSSPPAPAPAPASSIPALASIPEPEPEPELFPALQPDPSELTMVKESQSSTVWKSLHVQLHDIRTNHVTSIRAYKDNFWDFLNQFERALSEGGFPGSAAADVYKTALNDTYIVGRHYPALARWSRLNLMSRLASGVKAAREVDHSFLLRSSDMYMLQLVQHEANVHSADLLSFAMANLRPGPGRKYYDIVLKTLDHFFNSWRGAELHGSPQNCDWPEIAQSSQLASMWAGRFNRQCQNVEALLANGEVREARYQIKIAKRCFARVQRFTLKSATLMSDDSIMAEKIASALTGNDSKHYRILCTQATRLLGEEKNSWSRAKYNWLQVMARLPQISTSQFKRLLDLFARRGYAALSQSELCNLLLLHWEGAGKIKPDGKTRDIWNTYRGHMDSSVLAALAVAINKTTSPVTCSAIFWGLWDILRVHGGSKAFLRQLSVLSKRQKLSDGFLKRLAWTSNDHRIALLIHSMSRRRRYRGINDNFWWPPFWEKFAGRLRNRWKYPPVDPINLLSKLLAPDEDPRSSQTPPTEVVERHCYEHLGEVETQPLDAQVDTYRNFAPLDHGGEGIKSRQKRFQRQVERLRFGLKLLVNARQVTDRQVLRAVTQFTVVLANKQGYLSARDLATLTSVMMRTLNKGQYGSTERFKWYLGVICRFLGEDACLQVGLILKRRRDTNWLTWRRRMARALELARQTRAFTEQTSMFQESDAPPLNPLWEKYINHNKRRAQRRRKLQAPMRRHRGMLIASCRSRLDMDKTVKVIGTNTPLT